MTYNKWVKTFKKRLSPLPQAERRRALEYYGELYGDKLDAGANEAQIVRGFGDPKAAADRIVAEYRADFAAAPGSAGAGNSVRRATAGDTAARAFAAALLFLFVGLPVLAVIFCLAAAGAALFLAGFAVLLAGIAYSLYFVVQLCMYGGMGYVAQLGIGLAAAGIGALLIPLFLYCTKWLFIACGKIFVWTGRIVRGKREVK